MKTKSIRLNEMGEIIRSHFADSKVINIYVGSNAATPTACLEALATDILQNPKSGPFMNVLHCLLLGPCPLVQDGLQERLMDYTVFSGEELRKAVNTGRAQYLPVSLEHLPSLLRPSGSFTPDLVLCKVRRCPVTGELSLGLSVEALHTALATARLVIAELDPSMPFTIGHTILHPTRIDYLIEDPACLPCYTIPASAYDSLSAAEKAIGDHIAERYVQSGCTLQVGIGKITEAVLGSIEKSQVRDLGVHTELYSDGLMRLQKAGIVTNARKAVNKGYSVTTLMMGTQELYDFVHMRSTVQMRSCDYTNAEASIRSNAPFVAINTAMGIDLFGNVWADSIDPRHHYSGVGGQPDFVRALGDAKHGTAIIAMLSRTHRGESKIIPTHPTGVSLTATAYDRIVLATEQGTADLGGLTVGEKAITIASLAHPDVREPLLRYIHENPLMKAERRMRSAASPYTISS